MKKETQLQVEAIKNGTVIDHIPAQVGIKVLKLFAMDKSCLLYTSDAADE